MPCCERIKFNDGTMAIVCSRGHRRAAKRCACGALAPYLCDWKTGPRKTCDAAICEANALSPAPDKHLCPTHQREYVAWRERRRAAA